MACVLRPSRFISISCCTSVPLSNGGPPPPRIGRLHTLVRGWGFFKRLYGDFYTGADIFTETFHWSVDPERVSLGGRTRTPWASNGWFSLGPSADSRPTAICQCTGLRS